MAGQPSPDVLLSVGRLNAIAHNLDVRGAARRAESAYRQLLVQQPDSPAGNYGYGLFLVSTGRPHTAIPLLKKAMALRVDPAPYTLGMTYLSIQETDKALVLLDGYVKAHPGDTSARALIQKIRQTT